MIKSISTDLTNLSNELKRRNNDIKKFCDIALPIAKQETLSSADMSKLLKPFLTSCNVNNARFANLSIPAINKLIISNNLNPDDLKDLLAGLSEASHLAIDIQLKILQCLPNLMSNYKDYLVNDSLLSLLTICINLTSNNNSTVVINTAFATLQQLFNYAFDKIPLTIEADSRTKKIEIDNESEGIMVDDYSYECYLIFQDLCKIIDKQLPIFFKQLNNIKINSVLEIIENILQNHVTTFSTHKELNYLLRIKLVPSLLRILNDEFSIIIRIMRILLILLNTQLSNLVIEGEIIISILNHILLNDNNEWNKILVLEVFKSLFHDFKNLESIFRLYDNNSNKKNVIKELFSILNNYLLNNNLNNQLIKNSLSLPSNLIISKNSVPKIPLLDLLDKVEPPTVSTTYSINLILQVLIQFTDGLTNFVNNLSPNSSNLESNIELINNLININYKDLYQLFNYMLHCSLDNDNFHSLIRSLQKFTHTTGLLGINNLRDDLLILLSKIIIKVPNNFTVRHLTSLRALINLAISLGSTLNESWDIIWITLQWCDYYINGPNEFSLRDDNWTKPNLDTSSIESSMNKLYSSIKDYPVESYDNLITSLMELFKKTLQVDDNEIKLFKIDDDKYLNFTDNKNFILCLQNKVFFIDKLFDISKITPLNFFTNDKIFDKYNNFFVNDGLMLKPFNLKHYIIIKYNDIIVNLTLESNKIEGIEEYNALNQLCLNGLKNLLIKLETNSSEVLKLNNMFEILEIILNTLSKVIESYDKRLNDEKSWSLIFDIIELSFGLIKNRQNDKIFNIINLSFTSLKLIMNEFIDILPISKFKILIDTLIKFGNQKSDLNISFSSISYFFTIGDTIKSKFEKDEESELYNEIEIDGIGKGIKSLDIYLLLQLIILSMDERAQVRDGSIQTFFEILEIHGESFNQEQWNIITSLVFEKLFVINEVPSNELKETINLKIDGIVSIYSKFLQFLNFQDWEKLMAFSNLLTKDLEFSIIFMDKFQTIFEIPINNGKMDIDILELFYSFWINLPIEYNLVNPEQYLQFLEKIVTLFPIILNNLYDNQLVDETKISKILLIFVKILRYPIILKKSDDVNLTPIQNIITNNIDLIVSKDFNDNINSLVIKELSNLIIYQFQIREKIESKLLNSNLKLKFKLPTFIALSYKSFELLEVLWCKIKDYKVIIDDGAVEKLIKSLLEIITNKSTDLWVRCNDFLLVILEKILNVGSHQDEIWKLIISSVIINFKNLSSKEESINISQYFKIIPIIIPHLEKSWAIDEFLKSIYDNSYLYKLNEIETELLGANDDIDSIIENLLRYDYDSSFGLIKPSEFHKFNKMKFVCLQELINYTTTNKFSLKKFKFFFARLLFCLRRILDDVKLSYRLPLLSIQSIELKLLLTGLNNYDLHDNYGLIKQIIPLLIKLSKYDIESDLVQDILLKFNTI